MNSLVATLLVGDLDIIIVGCGTRTMYAMILVVIGFTMAITITRKIVVIIFDTIEK